MSESISKTLQFVYDMNMSYKDTRSKYLLFAKIIVVVAAFGLGILIYANIGDDPKHLAYSMIAFIISVAALLLTVLQSTSIARQVQLTERAAHDIRATEERLASLIKDDHKLAREIHEDIELDHEIISILEEHGVGSNAEERHHVARKITQHLKNSQSHYGKAILSPENKEGK